jgi:uncharacterized damage-inducible protein DinB
MEPPREVVESYTLSPEPQQTDERTEPMFTEVLHFERTWAHEAGSTAKVLAALTEASLGQRVAEGHRTLGELAWHVVVSPKVILATVGLEVDGPTKEDPMPASLEGVRRTHAASSSAVATAVRTTWTDDGLRETVEFYGMRVPRGVVLAVTLFHEIHHRGQMIVLMRQAGLAVPKVYG